MFSHSLPLVLDGAMGTELERRGIDTAGSSWSARAIKTHPEFIQQIHEEYIRAGADIITTNTFRTNVRAQAGNSALAEELTMKSVQLAQSAREHTGKDVLIAGSIAPVADCFKPADVPISDDNIWREHRLLASWLVNAGVDLILIETMNSVREAIIALTAVKSVNSKLPVIVSLVPQNSTTLLSGIPLEDAFELIAAAGAEVISLNCAPIGVIENSLTDLARMAKKCGISFGFYPNASERTVSGWDLEAHTDSDFARLASNTLSFGPAFIGSCCGTTPKTTAGIRSAISQ